MAEITMDVELKQIDCCSCGVSFWISAEHKTDLISTKRSFFCTNGHNQSYITNPEDRLKRTIEQKDETIAMLERQLAEKCRPKRKKKTAQK